MATKKKSTKEQLVEKQKDAEQFALIHTPNFVHFSFKTVNGNIRHGGIRLDSQADIRMPYICVRTVGARSVLSDMSSGENSAKTAAKYVLEAMRMEQGEPPKDIQDTQTAQRLCEIFRQSTQGGIKINTEGVSRYLRQIFLPAEKGYINVTPISAAGISEKLKDACKKARERRAQIRSDKTTTLREKQSAPGVKAIEEAVFGIGGEKTQNIGMLAYSMKSPLFFAAPSKHRGLRPLIAQHYNGMRVRISRELFEPFALWFNQQRAQGEPPLPNARARARFDSYFETLAAQHMAQSIQLRNALLEKVSGKMSFAQANELISEDLDDHLAADVDVKRRSKGWEYAIAQKIMRELLSTRIKKNGHDLALVFDEHDISRGLSILEGALR